MEEWKEIPGYEGLYMVSNKGNVRNVRRNKLLRLPKTNNGYIRVYLCKNGKGYGKFVHRLVAEAFIPNPNNLPQINHKDEDKSNNCVENLEWCTAKYNNNYGTARIRSINTRIKNGYVNEENVGLSQEEWKKKYYEKYYEKNREKIREQKREYREKNKEKIREQKREYREKNKEKIKEYKREYYEENREKIREQNREYYEENREKIREQNREYKKKNREKINEKNREYMREYRKKRKENK